MQPLPRFTIRMRSGRELSLMPDEHVQARILQDWTIAMTARGNASRPPRRYDVCDLHGEWPYTLLLDPAAIESIDIYSEAATEDPAPPSPDSSAAAAGA